jgi:hypothetical protein
MRMVCRRALLPAVGSVLVMAARVSKRLLDSRTESQQKAGVAAVGRWCSTTLLLRCSAIECGGGRRVKNLVSARSSSGPDGWVTR